MKAKKVAVLAVAASLAMVLSYVEAVIPISIGIPGVKVGLANIIVVFALFRLSVSSAAVISAVRVAVSGMLFGSPVTFSYAAAGAVLSFLVMLALKSTHRFSPVGVSIAGGVTHNFAQIGVAILFFGQPAIASYLPVLTVSGIVFGVFVGIIGAVTVKKVRLPRGRD